MKYCETEKLKESLTVSVRKNTASKDESSLPKGKSANNVSYLDECSQQSMCGADAGAGHSNLFMRDRYSSNNHFRNTNKHCVDSECHKSMMGLLGNVFQSFPSADRVPHITHTLQITPQNGANQYVNHDNAASSAASSHLSSYNSSGDPLNSQWGDTAPISEDSSPESVNTNYMTAGNDQYGAGTQVSRDSGLAQSSKVKSVSKSAHETNYVPMGPFKDHNSRAMEHEAPGGYKYDAKKCSVHCTAYKYFGLQDGGQNGPSQCFCSNDIKNTTKYGKADCGKNGGPWCNYVHINNTKNKNYGDANFMTYLGGYAHGNSQELYPAGSGFNSLSGAMKECDNTEACGGVTISPTFNPPYSMRKSKTPTKFDGNKETSWVKNR
jgi:hypothetical protein